MGIAIFWPSSIGRVCSFYFIGNTQLTQRMTYPFPLSYIFIIPTGVFSLFGTHHTIPPVQIIALHRPVLFLEVAVFHFSIFHHCARFPHWPSPNLQSLLLLHLVSNIVFHGSIPYFPPFADVYYNVPHNTECQNPLLIAKGSPSCRQEELLSTRRLADG